MKIAVLLFGHLRTFEFCSKYLKENLLDRYDCDVFLHTWDEIDSSTVSWNNKVHIKKEVDEEIKDKILNLYCPKSYRITKQSIEEDHIVISKITGRSTSLNGMNFMFKSLNYVNNLRKEYELNNKRKYDLIFVTRPDIAIFNPLPNLEMVNKEAEAIGFNLDNIRFFCGLSSSSIANVTLMCHRGCDMLFWGRSKVIDTFIKSNLCLTTENIETSFYNVCTIYAANEIKNGNIPQQVCFAFGKDWKNIKFEDPILVDKTYRKVKQKKMIYKLLHLYWLRGKK